ncbi:hypothetical protein RJG79_08060 [Mycoplasmatota bacterium WC44]
MFIGWFTTPILNLGENFNPWSVSFLGNGTYYRLITVISDLKTMHIFTRNNDLNIICSYIYIILLIMMPISTFYAITTKKIRYTKLAMIFNIISLVVTFTLIHNLHQKYLVLSIIKNPVFGILLWIGLLITGISLIIKKD